MLSHIAAIAIAFGILCSAMPVMAQESTNDETTQEVVENNSANEASEDMNSQNEETSEAKADDLENDADLESELVEQDAVDKENELNTKKKPWYYISPIDIVAQLAFIAVVTLIGYFMYVRAKK